MEGTYRRAHEKSYARSRTRALDGIVFGMKIETKRDVKVTIDLTEREARLLREVALAATSDDDAGAGAEACGLLDGIYADLRELGVPRAPSLQNFVLKQREAA